MARSNRQPSPGAGIYEPGSTVLVRAKGYPAWPAVVVEDEDVPEAVLAARPRKKTVFPVLFYNDFSFLWLTPSDCKPLTADAARKAAQASRIGKQVKDAYLVAADPPDYKEYVANATKAAEPEPEPEPEVPAPAPTGRKGRSRGRAKSAADQASSTPKPAARMTTTRKRSSEPEPSSKKKQKVEEPEAAEAEVSEEAGDDEYIENSTVEESDYSEGLVTDDLAFNQEARLELCLRVRQVAQETLLDTGKADEGRLANSVKLLEDAPEIEVSVVRRSKLNRVIAAALAHTKVPTSVRDRLVRLDALWNTPAEPVIRGIPEALAPKEETAEPEELISKDPTEEPIEGLDGADQGTLKAEVTSELAGSEEPSELLSASSDDLPQRSASVAAT